MKKLFMIAVLSGVIYSCKSVKVATPAPNTMSKPGADTALQGDKQKDPTKQ